MKKEALYAFILAHTTVETVPFVPELRLHLATQMEGLWLETESLLDDRDCEPPFWAFAWAGGLGLARYVLDHPETVRGLRVLDFASGSGLVGLAAAKAGAKTVWSCDIDPLAQEAARLNAVLNDVALGAMEVTYLKQPVKGVDVILAGDVCYDFAMAPRVVAWLRLCARNGTRVLLGDPGRAYVPTEGVEPLATYRVPTSLAVEDLPEREVRVLTLG